MGERLGEALRRGEVAHDVRVAGDFVRLFCDGHHADRERRPCEPKPFCSECETHCYSERRREHVREVMRYSGRRSFHIHPVESVRHMRAVRREKKERA